MSEANRDQAISNFEDECRRITGEAVPQSLMLLVLQAAENLDPAGHKQCRSYIYRELFNFLSREREVGNGASLIYPTELVRFIRNIYPQDVKDYVPQTKKSRPMYEVTLEEVLVEYTDKDTVERCKKH